MTSIQTRRKIVEFVAKKQEAATNAANMRASATDKTSTNKRHQPTAKDNGNINKHPSPNPQNPKTLQAIIPKP